MEHKPLCTTGQLLSWKPVRWRHCCNIALLLLCYHISDMPLNHNHQQTSHLLDIVLNTKQQYVILQSCRDWWISALHIHVTTSCICDVFRQMRHVATQLLDAQKLLHTLNTSTHMLLLTYDAAGIQQSMCRSFSTTARDVTAPIRTLTSLLTSNTHTYSSRCAGNLCRRRWPSCSCRPLRFLQIACYLLPKIWASCLRPMILPYVVSFHEFASCNIGYLVSDPPDGPILTFFSPASAELMHLRVVIRVSLFWQQYNLLVFRQLWECNTEGLLHLSGVETASTKAAG